MYSDMFNIEIEDKSTNINLSPFHSFFSSFIPSCVKIGRLLNIFRNNEITDAL